MLPAPGLFPSSSSSVDQTRHLGAQLAAVLEPGDIVALQGDLGSGKTEFVRGACAALGVEPATVTSPTFTIVNEYAGRDVPIFHIDAYRLGSETEFYNLGYEDYFASDAIVFVEWPDRIAEILAGEAVTELAFEHLGGNSRRIDLRSLSSQIQSI